MKKKKRLSKSRILKNLPSNKVIILLIIFIIGVIYLLLPQKSDPLTFDFGDLSYVKEVNGEFLIRVPFNVTNISEKEIRVKKVTMTIINMTSRDSTFWEEPSTPVLTGFDLQIQSKETLRGYIKSGISWAKDPVFATVKYTFYLEPIDIVTMHIVKLHFPLVYTSEIDIIPINLEVKIIEGDTVLIFGNKIRNNSPVEIHITEYGIQVENGTTKDGVLSFPDRRSWMVQVIIGVGEEFILNNTLILDVMEKELTEVYVLFDCLIEETNGGKKWGLTAILILKDDDTYLINQEEFIHVIH